MAWRDSFQVKFALREDKPKDEDQLHGEKAEEEAHFQTHDNSSLLELERKMHRQKPKSSGGLFAGTSYAEEERWDHDMLKHAPHPPPTQEVPIPTTTDGAADDTNVFARSASTTERPNSTDFHHRSALRQSLHDVSTRVRSASKMVFNKSKPASHASLSNQ
jgi:hypothetical protein